MPIRTHYRTIQTYRVLPPRWKIIEPAQDSRSPAEQYLAGVDALLDQSRSGLASASPDDIVSLVVANQSLTHELTGRHLAMLIQERRDLAARQIADIETRLSDLRERTPFRSVWARRYNGEEVTDLERQIDALELQKRALELALWRDVQELRTGVVEARRELDSTRRRISYLSGGLDGSA